MSDLAVPEACNNIFNRTENFDGLRTKLRRHQLRVSIINNRVQTPCFCHSYPPFGQEKTLLLRRLSCWPSHVYKSEAVGDSISHSRASVRLGIMKCFIVILLSVLLPFSYGNFPFISNNLSKAIE